MRLFDRRSASSSRQAALLPVAAAAVGLAMSASDFAHAASSSLSCGVATAAPNVAAAYYSSLPNVLGYWEAENIDVTCNGLPGSGPVVQALQAGTIEVGVFGSNVLFSAVQRGVPIVGYFSPVPVQYTWPAVLPDSQIEGVGDLVGKTFGVPSLESGSVPMARAWVSIAGGDPTAAQMVAVGVGADAMLALQRSDVDVLSATDNIYAEIEARGQPLRLLKDNDVINNAGFQTVIAGPKELMKAKPDAYVGFARAVAKSLVFIRENPECATYAHWHAFPASRPSGVTEEEAVKQAVSIWRARQPATEQVEGKWGFAADENIVSNLKLQELGGQIEAGLEPSDVADFTLIEAINDFDVDAVKAQARACDFPWYPK